MTDSHREDYLFHSVHTTLCLSFHPSVRTLGHPSSHTSIHQFTHSFTHLVTYSSPVYSHIYSIYLSIHPFIHVFINNESTNHIVAHTDYARRPTHPTAFCCFINMKTNEKRKKMKTRCQLWWRADGRVRQSCRCGWTAPGRHTHHTKAEQ